MRMAQEGFHVERPPVRGMVFHERAFHPDL
jgi:hypothetical protein